MLQAYVDHVAERAALGIPPLPLTAKQTGEVIELMKNATSREGGSHPGLRGASFAGSRRDALPRRGVASGGGG